MEMGLDSQFAQRYIDSPTAGMSQASGKANGKLLRERVPKRQPARRIARMDSMEGNRCLRGPALQVRTPRTL